MKNEMLSAYRYASEKLTENGTENAQTDARILTEAAFGTSLARSLSGRCVFPENSMEKLGEMLRRRIDGEPLQYIIGSWDFMGYTFNVGTGVLIPRSETEVLVEQAVKRLKKYRIPTVYDLCSGSGCIGLSIKKLLPDARVFLVEKSKQAIYYLNENRVALGLDHTTVTVKGDIFDGYDAFSSLPKPDCIISNPPYIKTAELPTLQAEVRMEPAMALDGGNDGLDFYRVLSEKWFPYINKDGFITMECGENQAGMIADMFPSGCKKQIFSDYCGVERFITVDRGEQRDL